MPILAIDSLNQSFRSRINQVKTADIENFKSKRDSLTRTFNIKQTTPRELQRNIDAVIGQNIRIIENEFLTIDDMLSQGIHYPRALLLACSVKKASITDVRKKDYDLSVDIEFVFDNSGISRINQRLNSMPIKELKNFVEKLDFEKVYDKNIKKLSRKHKDIEIQKSRNGTYSLKKNFEEGKLYAILLDANGEIIQKVKISDFSERHINNSERKYNATLTISKDVFERAKYLTFNEEYRAYHTELLGTKATAHHSVIPTTSAANTFSLRVSPFFNYYDPYHYARLRIGGVIELPLNNIQHLMRSLTINPAISIDFGETILNTRRSWSAGITYIPSIYGMTNSVKFRTAQGNDVKRYMHEIGIHYCYHSIEMGIGYTWKRHPSLFTKEL